MSDWPLDWTSDQDLAGKAQGWFIAYTNAEGHAPYELHFICDSGGNPDWVEVFDTDDEAIRFVKAQAESETH